MELLIPTYTIFYKTLRMTLEEKILQVLPNHTYKSENDFWNTEDPNTRKNILQTLIKVPVSALHFKRKYEEEAKSRTEIMIKDSFFIAVCENMFDLSISKNYSKISDPAKKAVHLYFVFLEKYCPDYLEKEKRRLGHYLQGNDDIDHEEISDLNIIKKRNGEYQIGQSISRKGLAVVRLINQFYSQITKKDYKSAWQLLTPDFQKRAWLSSFDQFREGYLNTIDIKHLHIFEVQEGKLDSFECKIYYEDTVNVFYAPDFKKLNVLSLTDIEEFNKILQDFRNKVKSAGLDTIDNVEIVKLFELTFSEYIRFTRNIPQETISKILPRHESVEVPRLFTISCSYIDFEWKIRSIRPIRSALLR